MAPSQVKLPPTKPILATRTWQHICADYFYMGHRYLIVVDRYSNWPVICKSVNGARCLIDQLRITFTTFGVPEEIATDGGPEFTSGTTTQFFRIRHRLSSVAFPHSNCRAEIGVKSMKRLISGNVENSGDLISNEPSWPTETHRTP